MTASDVPSPDAAPETPAASGVTAEGAAKPAKQDEEVDEAERRAKALARLMHRISEHADFPSLRDSIGGIQKIARSDRAHVNQLSGLVLNDVGMTSKLLRIINAAFYVSVGGGSITSMDRAVALMGFESVGMLAASLMLFEKAPKGRDGEAARQACSKALLAGLLAQQMCHSRKHVESVYLTALFMNLGKMLVVMHFPNEARAIQAKTDEAVASMVRQAEANAALHTGAVKQPPQGPSPAQVHDISERVSREVLGLTHEELGIEVARQWGWPDNLTPHLRAFFPADTEREAGPEEYMRVLCTAASDLSVALHALPKKGKPEEVAEVRDACMKRFGQTWGLVLKIEPETLPELGELAMEKWAGIAEFLGIKADGSAAEGKSGARVESGFQPKRPPALRGPDRISQGLAHALKGLAEAANSYSPLDHVLEQLMADLTEALLVQRVVVCMRHPEQGHLQGHLGSGVRATAVVGAFHVPLQGSSDLFSVLCTNAKDALITDTTDTTIAKRLPSWYQQKVGARTFVLLPLVQHASVHGLLYADRQLAGSLVLSDKEMALLKTVRNHLLVAMEQRGLTQPR
ncbi:MAG TPA: HDOD domain-containing protein [Burkholderiaceae bacterium]|nr:HDOD domain-containing protein [Burkholderiaceae bacterium]